MLGLVGALALTACQDTSSKPIVDPPEPISKVIPVRTTLPVSIGAMEDMPLNFHGENDCSYVTGVEIVSQTSSKLVLKAEGYDLSNCPTKADPKLVDFHYAFKTTEPRTNPYEVWVNDVKAGTVEIK